MVLSSELAYTRGSKECDIYYPAMAIEKNILKAETRFTCNAAKFECCHFKDISELRGRMK
jgi:hypothetical protein